MSWRRPAICFKYDRLYSDFDLRSPKYGKFKNRSYPQSLYTDIKQVYQTNSNSTAYKRFGSVDDYWELHWKSNTRCIDIITEKIEDAFAYIFSCSIPLPQMPEKDNFNILINNFSEIKGTAGHNKFYNFL